MKRQTFNGYIGNNQFHELFIMEMGWNNVHGNAQLPMYVIDEKEISITAIAERNGFQVLKCVVEEIPSSSFCKKLDLKLRKQADSYILIFQKLSSLHHLWVAPVKKTEKRDLVFVEYETLNQADFLFSKIDGLTFDVDESTTIMDVKERIQSAFVVNSEKLTKDFYQGFRKQHTSFVKFISGIDDEIDVKQNKNKQWYASIMLNRLMFCYFIQKKGFLDNNTNYLRDKLAWVRREQGENRFFHSFYRGFLTQLFHDGLNDPRHPREFEILYGRIPYLNGGMFDEHTLEQEYANIDISDEAFEGLFAFFDQWHWHLDDRHTATGKDINPDVLGYIFEQYINDRAAMGAYYTKEDITEYIGKNCILPFLMDKVRTTTKDSEKYFRSNGYVWQTLAQSGDSYIYEAMKRGFTEDWQEHIPDYIAQGIDTNEPNLLERRSRWNERTSEKFALPTEIWRETVERLQRCSALLEKIYAGDITEINDFITYNLDIRQFVYDLLLNANDHHFVAHFYHAMQNVTILDPTCGSGAFLFAAMNILEPLYEVCIERMEQWHDENPNLFKDELEEINRKYRSNRQYFIYKSIILRNLYGVDIMAEATEIAKLRLFLKMVAVVEVDMRADNLGLDPLPDIDFNIRCGNTLVGYATEAELERDLTWGDMFANQEFREKIEDDMDKTARAFNVFKQVQFRQEEEMIAFKQAKQELKKRLSDLDNSLNQRLFASSGDGRPEHFEDWKRCHQPFHWLAEFYEIIQGNGGFDVIIGNPPYVVYSKKNVKYSIDNYETTRSGNLYSYVMERSFAICHQRIGLIVQMSSVATESMKTTQKLFFEKSDAVHYSIFPERPKQLFDGACIALSILLCRVGMGDVELFGSGISRFADSQREIVFKKLGYIPIQKTDFLTDSLLFPKFGNTKEHDIFRKLTSDSAISKYFTHSGNNLISYRTAGGRYWKPFINRRFASASSTNKSQPIVEDVSSSIIVSVFNSNLFWWYYANFFDLFHLTEYMFSNFRFNITANVGMKLQRLGKSLMLAFERNKISKEQFVKSQNHVTISESFNPQMAKSIIDEIDKALAKHYGFTDEELDFIINYDIKYRMGDEQAKED